MGSVPNRALRIYAVFAFRVTCNRNRYAVGRTARLTVVDTTADTQWQKPKRLDSIDMTTIFRVHGLRVVIYSNDHPPPHVHVIGPDGEARIALGDENQHPSLMANDGLSRRQLAASLSEIDENRVLLLQCWREIHGNS